MRVSLLIGGGGGGVSGRGEGGYRTNLFQYIGYDRKLLKFHCWVTKCTNK